MEAICFRPRWMICSSSPPAMACCGWPTPTKKAARQSFRCFRSMSTLCCHHVMESCHGTHPRGRYGQKGELKKCCLASRLAALDVSLPSCSTAPLGLAHISVVRGVGPWRMSLQAIALGCRFRADDGPGTAHCRCRPKSSSLPACRG